MKKTAILISFLLVILFPAGRMEAGEETTVDGVGVALVDLPVIKTPCAAYLEVRVVFNNPTSGERRIQLKIPGNSSGHASAHGGMQILSVRRSFTLAPGARESVSLFFPSTLQLNQLEIMGASGKKKELRLNNSYRAWMNASLHGTTWARAPVLLGPQIDPGDFIPLLPPESTSPRGRRSSVLLKPEARMRRDLARLPEAGFIPGNNLPEAESWLSFSPFGAIVISRSGLGTLSQAGMASIGDWVRLGGFLIITGDSAGDGPSLFELQPGETVSPALKGFGGIFSLSETKIDTSWWKKHQESWVKPLRNRWNLVLKLPEKFRAANSTFRIPSRFLFFFLLVFCILAGPLSSIYLKKKRKPLWILWTTPLLAIVVSGGLIVFVMVREGFSPLERTRAVSILDQVNHRVYSNGMTALYTPRSHARPLRVSSLTEIMQAGGSSSTGSLRIDWTEGLKITGWNIARGETGFVWRDVRDSSLRLVFKKGADGAFEVFNALDTPIESLLLRDKNGVLHTGGGIKSGGRRVLMPVHEIHSWREAIHPQGLFKDLVNLGADTVIGGAVPPADNTYLALVPTCPFMDLGIGRTRRIKDGSLILGLLDSGALEEGE